LREEVLHKNAINILAMLIAKIPFKYIFHFYYFYLNMKKSFLPLLIFLLTISACDKDTKKQEPGEPDLNNIKSFGVLDKLKGIWSGPVTSTTALGSYPEWVVDFRPISENHISAKNELDTLNDIFMSFFVCKYNNEYRVAFRNGGSFAGMHRVSYFIADSISESTSRSFYRFVEIKNGASRAFTDVIFNNDSLHILSYTNKYNTLSSATLHMAWRAGIQYTTAATAPTQFFGFPKKTMTKDFTSSFDNTTEAVFYSLSGDPFPESAFPYLGNSTINYSFAPNLTPQPNKLVFLLITTQPLINGFSIDANNWKTRSRYVILSSSNRRFNFNYMHPGTYYVYGFYDQDGNKQLSSGDWVSSSNTSFVLGDKGNTNATVQINFTIP
jgi:hypothetical protein